MKSLPEPKLQGRITVEEAIARRRSVRDFVKKSLSDEELSQLLWAAQGITDKANNYRAAPSAGPKFPLETYVAMAEGLFHYLPEKHSLELIKKSDERRALAEAALNQRWMETAAAIFIFTAVFNRTTHHYGQRGVMYVHMEAGHAAENLHLQAVALDLGSTPVGPFDDERVARILGITKTETPLYLIPVGKEARPGRARAGAAP